MNELWPWILLAGLGAFHGLNPAMGWLFAVALGMQRRSGRSGGRLAGADRRSGTRWRSPPCSTAAVLLGLVVDGAALAKVVGAVLIRLGRLVPRLRPIAGGCASACRRALWRPRRLVVPGGDRARRRPDALCRWRLPLCLSDGPAAELGGSLSTGLAAVGVHSGRDAGRHRRHRAVRSTPPPASASCAAAGSISTFAWSGRAARERDFPVGGVRGRCRGWPRRRPSGVARVLR